MQPCFLPMRAHAAAASLCGSAWKKRFLWSDEKAFGLTKNGEAGGRVPWAWRTGL